MLEHAQETVIDRIGVRTHRDRLAAQVGRGLDAGVIGMDDDLHQRMAAQHRHDLDGNAVRAQEEWRIADRAPGQRRASAYLLGHLYAAPVGRHQVDLQSLLLEVPPGLGEYPGREARQRRRRRRQDGDFLERGRGLGGGSGQDRTTGQRSREPLQ
ncbi:hypothetical protein CDO44_09500 [Pigmentiphaga sp. NML080357]|nr:hypothetical protein CDO44_09500 [Pigmentiphaga sp. NML080357]